MRPELTIFITENYSLEKQGLFNRAFSVFEDYSLDDYDVPFIELITQFDSRDYLETIDSFESLIKNTLLSVISEQGVELNEDVTLEIIVEVAAGLFDIQYYEDKESIIRTIEVDFDSEEKLANLLVLVTNINLQQLIGSFESVNENIFNLILTTCDSSDSQEADPVENTKSDQEVVSKLRMFREYTKLNDLIAFRILEKGFRIKLSYDFYNRYLKSMITDFKDLDRVAKEYLAVLFMAKESYLNPINHFRKISSSISDDITLITKLDVQITKVFNDFDKYKINYLNIQSNIGIENSGPIFTLKDSIDDIPVGVYSGLATGYEAEFKYNNKKYTVINTKIGVKGRDIPCLVTKVKDGYFTVGM